MDTVERTGSGSSRAVRWGREGFEGVPALFLSPLHALCGPCGPQRRPVLPVGASDLHTPSGMKMLDGGGPHAT